MKKDTDFLKLLNHLSSFLMRTRMATQELEASVNIIIAFRNEEIEILEESRKHRLKPPKRRSK